MYKSHYLCIVSRSPDGEKETRVLFKVFIFCSGGFRKQVLKIFQKKVLKKFGRSKKSITFALAFGEERKLLSSEARRSLKTFHTDKAVQHACSCLRQLQEK